ncbi:MAG: patatin-like phospholipase family protein [Gammaproteobacteria bacterium]
MPEQNNRGTLALAVSGGGARAAYQVGFLRWLVEHYPDLEIPILTGVSAGAINTVYLANHQGTFRDKVKGLAAVWETLTLDRVFRVDAGSIAAHVARWGMRLLMGTASHVMETRSLVDASPLQALLEQVLKPVSGVLGGIHDNLLERRLRAVAITTSNYSTGQSVTWIQGINLMPWTRAHRIGIPCTLRIDHILASASLPLFFPAVNIGGCWYGDGGIRMTAPLSPAVHLGADRILAISTKYAPSTEEVDCPTIDGYPPPVQVVGALYNALFLDVFDYDALRIERINSLVKQVPLDKRGGLRCVDLLLLRPSCDLGKLANAYEPELPGAFRFMTRGLGTQETRSNDLLSVLMFQPDYLQRLADLGYADAGARREEISAFFAKSALCPDPVNGVM